MRKLWNRPDLPVWSLSTLSENGVPNMNICTYVSAVSLEPKLIMVAVYKDTQTVRNVQKSSRVLLQLLTEELAPVVRICGKQSGKDRAKIPPLSKRYGIEYDDTLSYFTQAAGYMILAKEQLIETSGDHVLFIGRVVKTKNTVDGEILTTTHLRAHGYIR